MLEKSLQNTPEKKHQTNSVTLKINGGLLPCSLVSAPLSPAELFCAGFGSVWCATSSLVNAAADEELVEEAATVVAVKDEGACLETPPAAPLTPLWLAVAACLDGLRWLPVAGLLE